MIPTNVMSLFGHSGVRTVVGPSRDRSLPGKARRRARKAQNAEQRASVPRADTGTLAPVAVALIGLDELEAMSVADLKVTAKNLGLRGYSMLRKDSLVEFIYRSKENNR
jgi:hypothetical protein